MQLVTMPRSLLRASQRSLPSFSVATRQRWQALAVWEKTGTWQAAADIFGISRATLFRWRQHLRRDGTLAPHSRRPHRVRQPHTPAAVLEQIRTLREQYPRWGREKLRVLLAREGIRLSAKTIDRCLACLRAHGRLVEPPRQAISARKRLWPRPYAVRKPKDYAVTQPGDLVQLDTLDIRPLPGVGLKQFTAQDVLSRWDVLEAYSRATSVTATRFLDTVPARMPFPIRALQVDGGGEFAAAFEQACQQRGIRLFVLPPRSPKLNGRVERAQRTHTEEFYECYAGDFDLPTLRQAQRAWEHTYNHIRPHQALDYLTLAEFLANDNARGPASHM